MDPHHIQFAQPRHVDAIIAFIKTYWREDHIYVLYPHFFRYDFAIGDPINFVIALNHAGEIDGILGYYRYKETPQDNDDLFTAMWKVRPGNGDPTLGIKLLQFLHANIPHRSVSGVGANLKILPIYRYLGYNTGQLKHYFMLNDRLKAFKILGNRERAHRAHKMSVAETVEPYDLLPFPTFEALASRFNPDNYKDQVPYKSAWYLNKRYFNHPFYTYQVFGIINTSGTVNGILICREQAYDGARILRIVDFVGDTSAISHIRKALKNIVYQQGYEYVDFYQLGIADAIMEAAGFEYKPDDAEVIIPNHFEPFTQSNVPIHIVTTVKDDNLYLLKADGDQDRPNKVSA